jgi:2-polyprenyl-6-hydroxyphenyl methylase / 3-demethylubiquinone-9 3-methyltransferase
MTMSAIASEIDRFNRLAATWWDSAGPMRPLHVVNRLRLSYLLELIDTRLATLGRPIHGLRLLDIGCGAGLLCEPLAQLGAQVTGIDAAARNIAAARAHAISEGLRIDYRSGEPAAALAAEERFDLVLLLEVVEHVADVESFVARAARHVAPGGLLVASTIDRSLSSFLFAIVGAEYVFRVLPRGTHEWRRFVRPAELQAAARGAGLEVIEQRGMRYLPVLHRASWVRDTSVNYITAFARAGADAEAGPGSDGPLALLSRERSS